MISLFRKIRLKLASLGIIKMRDEAFLRSAYLVYMGEELDLERPKTFNEKLQWLKLYDRNPRYTEMVDKQRVKKLIAKGIGERYVIPTIKVYDDFDEIDFDELPDKFVLKCNHNSGGVYVCKDKNKIDKKKLRRFFNKQMKQNFYDEFREWPYKNVIPKIIAEKYYEDSDGELKDYKFYCFDGEVDYCLCCVDRQTDDGVKFYYFDKNWNMKKDFSKDGLERPRKVPRPKNLDKMFELAGKLSKGIDFVRIDLYNVDGEIYFGEYTFYPSAGFDNTRTPAVREYLDNKLIIKDKR